MISYSLKTWCKGRVHTLLQCHKFSQQRHWTFLFLPGDSSAGHTYTHLECQQQLCKFLHSIHPHKQLSHQCRRNHLVAPVLSVPGEQSCIAIGGCGSLWSMLL